MVGVLTFGLLEGLVIAALIGLISLLAGTKSRSTSILGKVPETAVYRSVDNYPEAEIYPGLLILRFDGTLYFANTHDFQTAVRRAIEITDPSPDVILIDGESINDIDATAVITMREFQKQLESEQIEFRFARIKTHVKEIMERGGLLQAVPAEHFYPTVQEGVDSVLAEQ
jgi:MFS superfamily sulfate permease-like transporter